VAIKFVMPEHDSSIALKLLRDYQKQIHELLAPDVFPLEIAHALTKFERRNLLLQGEAIHKFASIMINRPSFKASLTLLPRAIQISSQKRIGVYDCLYVALAEAEGCELVTADTRLIANLPGFPIVSLASLP
jgi:predicted nucleic acid-binding protein